jgi:hypothetical protein
MKASAVGRRASRVLEPVAYLDFVYVMCTAIAIRVPVIAYVSWAAALHNVTRKSASLRLVSMRRDNFSSVTTQTLRQQDRC